MEEQEQLLEILQLPSVLTQPADDMNSRAAVHHRSASQSHRHHMPRFLRWKKSHNTRIRHSEYILHVRAQGAASETQFHAVYDSL